MKQILVSGLLSICLVLGSLSNSSNQALAEPVELLETSQCQLPAGPRPEADFGFPRSTQRLPAEGTISAVMIFVDFPDARGTDEKDLASVGVRYTRNFKKFYSAQSYGRVSFEIKVIPKYFRLASKTSSYKMNLRKGQNGDGAARYFQDSLKAADTTVDFTGVDVVFVVPSNTNKEITYGPAFPLRAEDDYLRTDEGLIRNGAVAGTDSRLRENSLEWSWMAHETGHLFGLGHPWPVTADAQGRTSDSSNAAVWDLMSSINKGSTGEFLGWSRFLIGWLGQPDAYCIDADSVNKSGTEIRLRPLAQQSPAKKFLMIKTGDQTAIAVEIRTNSGLNKFPGSWEGPLVYKIDSSKAGYEGVASLITPNKTRDYSTGLKIGTLKPGQKVSANGLSIQYVGRRGADYVLKVTR